MSKQESETTPARPIYLDYQATSPLDPRVLDAMLPFFRECFGNSHSAHHAYGWEAERAVATARARIAALIGAHPAEIIFTSGATEANNLAIRGAATFHGARSGHLVIGAIEHDCVRAVAADLAQTGFAVTTLPVGGDGLVDPAALEDAIRNDTVLVSIMAVNHEIGTVQPLAELGAICAARGVLFHSDAAQAAGKIPLDVVELGLGLMSLSGHKLYGPKGIGALYVRRHPRVRLAPQMLGGGQERGLRAGTLPTPLCVGLGAACAIAGEEMTGEAARLHRLRDRFLDRLAVSKEAFRVNGSLEARIPGNLNLAFPGLDAVELLTTLDDLALSTGSACASARLEPSPILRAIGLDDALAHASIRIGFGRFTSAAEIDFAAERIGAAVADLRAESAAESG